MATKDRGIRRLPDGRLEIRVRGKDPRTGKRKEVRRVFLRMGIREARQKQEEMRVELEHSGTAGRERVTLTGYARRWLKSRKVAGDRTSTMDNRVQVLEHHILPQLGDTYVDAIMGQDIRQWLVNSASKYKPAPKSKPDRKEVYGAETVNGWLRVLKVMLRDAVVDLGLERDPTMRIQDRKVEPREEGKALSAVELGRLLEAARALGEAEEISFGDSVLLLVGFLTGMRWSELTALEWRDLDEELGCVRIRRAQVRKVVAGTKTRKVRTVPVPEVALGQLRELRRRQVRDQVPGLEKGIIFPSNTGDYRFPSSIKRALRKVCKAAEIERHVTPHWMRHTFNNLLRQAKVDHIVLRATTGHSTSAMTEHYSHVDLEEKQEATARVLELVGMGGEKG